MTHFPNAHDLTRMVRDSIKMKTISKHFEIHASTGDGHCFLHSVVQFLDMSTYTNAMSLSELLADINSERISNSARYTPFYTPFYSDSSITQLNAEMKMFVENKIYNTRFGDMVPLITTNVLVTNLIKRVCGRLASRNVQPSKNDHPTKTIIVHKSPDKLGPKVDHDSGVLTDVNCTLTTQASGGLLQFFWYPYLYK